MAVSVLGRLAGGGGLGRQEPLERAPG